MLALHSDTTDQLLDIVAVAIPALIAAVASVYVAKLTRQARDRFDAQDAVMDTGNGRGLGETVHDMAQTVEVLSAQVHTATSIAADADAHAREAVVRLDDWIVQSTEVHDELLRRLPEGGPDGPDRK